MVAAGSNYLLWITLYRLKTGCTFRELESVFGWSKSTISEWFSLVMALLDNRMHCFHHGFLTYMGKDWQTQQLLLWFAKHRDAGNYEEYVAKVQTQNAHSQSVNHIDVIKFHEWIASLAGVDGTYSIEPGQTNHQLEANGYDPTRDVTFSNYKKVHGHKVMLAISHGLGEGKKYVLYLEWAAASASDAAVYGEMLSKMYPSLCPGASFLGDHAFHGAMLVIAPYSKSSCLAGRSVEKTAFNHHHSSDRMCSEHGVRFLKTWGAFRGRSDTRLFKSDDIVKAVFNVVWALHNYRLLGTPAF